MNFILISLCSYSSDDFLYGDDILDFLNTTTPVLSVLYFLIYFYGNKATMS